MENNADIESKEAGMMSSVWRTTGLLLPVAVFLLSSKSLLTLKVIQWNLFFKTSLKKKSSERDHKRGVVCGKGVIYTEIFEGMVSQKGGGLSSGWSHQDDLSSG